MNVVNLNKQLHEHKFRELFIEELGWDIADNCIEFQVGHRAFSYRVIAHKRGFAVLVGQQHGTLLADRYLLRKVQKQIHKFYHEHIVIHYSERPFKQVWQWAIRTVDGRRLNHREHPFGSVDRTSFPFALRTLVKAPVFQGLCFYLASTTRCSSVAQALLLRISGGISGGTCCCCDG